MNDLDARLLAAHAQRDQRLLVSLYREAISTTQDPDEIGFFLTQAYVYALDSDHPDAPDLRRQLIALGRESQ